MELFYFYFFIIRKMIMKKLLEFHLLMDIHLHVILTSLTSRANAMVEECLSKSLKVDYSIPILIEYDQVLKTVSIQQRR